MAETQSLLEWTSLVGGLWLPESDEMLIPANALLQADDVWYQDNGALRGRRGFSRYDATDPANEDILFLWRHYPRTGSPAFLRAYASGTSTIVEHDTDDNGSFSTMTGGTVANSVSRPWATHWDELETTYLAAGDSDFGLRAYTGGVLSSVTLNSGAGYVTGIDGPYLTVWNSRLWMTKSDELNYSLYGSDIFDPTGFPTAGQLQIADVGGGNITGVEFIADRLIILKKTSLFWFIGDPRYSGQLFNYSQQGAIAPASIQRGFGGIIYVARDGVYLTDGNSREGLELSRPIRSLFKARDTDTAYANAVGGYHPLHRAYYLKLAPADAHTYICQQLQMSGPDGVQTGYAWSKHTSLPMTAAAAWDSENDDGSFYTAGSSGGTDGKVFLVNDGTTDDGTAFSPTIQLQAQRISRQSRQNGRPTWVEVLYRGSSQIQVNLRYDFSTTNQVLLAGGASGSTDAINRIRFRNEDGRTCQFVSPVIILPADAYDAELFSLTLQTTLRGSRVWG